MHPYLIHPGSDMCRGIREFVEEHRLGKSGLHWLKIHLANFYAGDVDKPSYDDRVLENHVDRIFDCANRPLEGRCCWLGAEDPFQCLALWQHALISLKHSSPESTISYMHVHQTTLTALRKMFEAARSIMSWPAECAIICLICFVYIVLCIILGMV